MNEFILFAVKSKEANKTNLFVLFLGKSMALQSAFGFIRPLPKWHSISKVNLFIQVVTLVMWPHPIMYRQRDLKVIITCPACLRTSLSNKGHCIWLREPRPRELFPSTVDFWQLTTEVTKGRLWGKILFECFFYTFVCLFVCVDSFI